MSSVPSRHGRLLRLARGTSLAVVLAFVVFPPVRLALAAVKTRAGALAMPPELLFTPTLEAYAKIRDNGAARAFANSFAIAVTNVALSLLLGVPAAYALARMRGRLQANLSFWILSIRLAPLFAVILPLYELFRAMGLRDTRLALAHRTVTLPLAVWLLMTYFRTLPRDLDEAAMLDGARPWKTLLLVVVPLSRPMLASVAVIVFTFSWNEFLLAFFLTSRDAQTVPVMVAGLAGTMTFDWPLIAAISVGSMLPALVFVGFAQRHIVAGLAAGAVK
jgi:multiple sugar transport system permease protein